MRVGLIGFGGIAQAHVAGWRAVRSVDVELHVFDTVPERRTAAGPVGVVHDSLAELLDAVEAVDICTPSDTHTDLVRAAAAAGRHVICEKPIALTVADAVNALGAARAAGVQVHVGHVVRFFGEYATAHAAVARGEIGTPAVLHFRRAGGFPTHNAWMADETRSGGVVMDLMIHDLDQARWTAGDVVRVFARAATTGRAGIPTHVLAVLTHASGAISHLTASWALAGGFETSFELAGSGGILRFDSTEHRPLRADRPELLDRAGLLPVMLTDSPFATELDEFARAIDTGSPTRVSAADAVVAVQLATAVRESIAAGTPVAVPAVPAELAELAELATEGAAATAGTARGTW